MLLTFLGGLVVVGLVVYLFILHFNVGAPIMIWWRDVLIIGLIVGLSIPVGRYIAAVMAGKKVWLSAVLKPVEKRIYRVLGYQDTPTEMSGRQFVLAIFGLISLDSPYMSWYH